ncbi:family 5 putative carbohydrate esterase [Triangularia verruculosa]|uniref:Family 5 putative carbohydrate esterase n=1 Tax=Triangularia verruculosa TaxID=2587418 RepID=A0AAN6XLW6_9PEZI|nr:family 5 putative carbohydrate esterase [Triangularia verruculosa]
MKPPYLPLHLLLTLPSPSKTTPITQQNPCPLLHILSARETTAPPGFGSSLTLTNLLLSTFNHSSGTSPPIITAEAITYPALGANDAEYAASVTTGTAAVVKQLSTFNAQCPETVVILHGYSQGGQIIDDALCGVPGEEGTKVGKPLVGRGVQRRVGGVVLMGSPGMISFCDEGDPFCSDGEEEGVHLRYGEVYGREALRFVVGRVLVG